MFLTGTFYTISTCIYLYSYIHTISTYDKYNLLCYICLFNFKAGEMFLTVKMVKEAIDMFIAGEDWDKARHVAKNVDPR